MENQPKEVTKGASVASQILAKMNEDREKERLKQQEIEERGYVEEHVKDINTKQSINNCQELSHLDIKMMDQDGKMISNQKIFFNKEIHQLSFELKL